MVATSWRSRVAARPGRGIEIHQAAGVVSAQLDTDVGTALAVIRARAFANGQSLRDLAADIVTRRVRLDD